mmetsp:Transcript_4530/g.13045  ORF Transcript_4530/g.13045 Transcript_4530/m.13045 type:complete len:219 (-) Transcript_4530:264-920(-)
MGASGSVLMATMTLESFIPLRCCMAPEIPAAMYRSGATTFPVCPTCQSLGQNPASTAAREAPTAAPSLSASASRMGKLSPLLIPLPPLTTMLALDRSGRSDFETDSPIHSALSKCSTTPSRVSTSTDEASTRSALSKQVGRTDRTLRLDPPGPGLATTLPSTLPAYIGRIKVSFVPYQNDDCGGCGGGDGSGSGSGYIMCCVANTGKARQQQKRQFLT